MTKATLSSWRRSFSRGGSRVLLNYPLVTPRSCRHVRPASGTRSRQGHARSRGRRNGPVCSDASIDQRSLDGKVSVVGCCTHRAALSHPPGRTWIKASPKPGRGAPSPVLLSGPDTRTIDRRPKGDNAMVPPEMRQEPHLSYTACHLGRASRAGGGTSVSLGWQRLPRMTPTRSWCSNARIALQPQDPRPRGRRLHALDRAARLSEQPPAPARPRPVPAGGAGVRASARPVSPRGSGGSAPGSRDPHAGRSPARRSDLGGTGPPRGASRARSCCRRAGRHPGAAPPGRRAPCG